jgi:hypothetical protein
MALEFGRIVQIGAAVLGIPAAAAGTYSAYQTYFTNDAVCQKLRTSILAVMEKNVAPDAKRTLLRRDVGDFDTKCGAADPDARTIFLAAVREPEPTALAVPAPANSAAPPPPPPRARVAAFVVGGTEQRGWVAIARKAEKTWHANFSGYPISESALPPAGTVLTALQPLPVWREPQAGANDPARLASSLARAACVKVVETRAGSGRLWAEVVPAPCP